MVKRKEVAKPHRGDLLVEKTLRSVSAPSGQPFGRKKNKDPFKPHRGDLLVESSYRYLPVSPQATDNTIIQTELGTGHHT